MDRDQLLQLEDKEILEIAEKLRIAYRLKKTLRYHGTRDFSIHGESVAEHVFALFFLAQYFLPLEDPENTLDKEKIYKMILFHDFGETIDGDIPYHLKTSQDEIKEAENAKIVFQSLPQSLGLEGESAWSEYEKRITPESKFVYALDKIEPIFELLDEVNVATIKRLKFTYEVHTAKKIKATKDFPVMRRFADVLSNYLKEQGVFWNN